MQGDDLAIELFLWGTTFAFGLAAVTMVDSGRKILVRVLWVGACFFLASAVLWPLIGDRWPSLREAAAAFTGHRLTFDMLGLAIFGMLVFDFIERQRRKPNQPDQPEHRSVQGKTSRGHLLKEVSAYAGQAGDGGFPPRVVVQFAKTGKNIEVCVDISNFVPNIMGKAWTKRRRLFICEIASFRRDEQFAIPLFWADQENGLQRWVWGDGNRSYSDRAGRTVQTNAWYRCRAAFISSDGSEEYCYFILRTGKDPSELPELIGYHMFAFKPEWDSEAA